MNYPQDKRFAFTLLDDTDDATLENVKPVYDALKANGLRTTKTVWPVDCPEGSRIYFAADTLARAPYLRFVRELQADGFEIAFHGATMESSRRERTVRALEVFRREFGAHPALFCNHGQNRDNLYWGHKRFRTGWLRGLVGLLRGGSPSHYLGEVEQSEFFWGDLCREHVRYVRNWTFPRLNMLEVNPDMPYRAPDAPCVNLWFSTADAPDVEAFVRLLTRERLERLEQAGGLCIISTHLGKGFARGGFLDPRVRRVLEDLSRRPGWYVPVSQMLDYLVDTQGKGRVLGSWKTAMLEAQYIAGKLWPAA
jgi:hypothetical protein